MFCPKCGTQNPSGTQTCRLCGHTLINSRTAKTAEYRRRSKIAVTSSSLAIGGLSLSVVIGIVAIHLPSALLMILCLLFSLLAGILAVTLGVIALVIIMVSDGQVQGMGLAIAGITVPIIWIPLSTLLVILPALATVRLAARDTKQRAQLFSIELALTAFKNDFGDYPPSDGLDADNKPYCGALKLSEALLGLDLMGFHPDSEFGRDGTDGSGKSMYVPSSVGSRRGPYVELGDANAYRLQDIFEDGESFDIRNFVVCDTYTKKRHSGKKTGMPIMYYKADTSKTAHDVNDPDNPENIYNYRDNHSLLALGVPGKPNQKHPLFEDPKIFYEMTKDYKVTVQSKPKRADTFILLSAGKDGLYGTKDDIANFGIEEWKHK